MRQVWRYAQAALGIIFRHPITGVTAVPVLEDGQIVLVRRRDDGRWSLPGGIVDWGEDVRTVLKRELAEETGLDVISVGRLVGVYSSPQRDSRFHSICITIEAQVKGSFEIQDVLEVSEVKAFALDALPPFGELSQDHGQQLRDYLDGKTVIC
ncbi:NUDIX hydrolase [Vacuolonema iberomarrocanum]|uniref:NUDIX hydrolase n=1 Tax=Vacuolonema iberomarrocanum TaxID=3454632 RepID=UPI0019DB6B9A|nr:NUDIX hydrolase [filamentous cyanobacterium LEGE 07170]